jgi:hypothetical protein
MSGLLLSLGAAAAYLFGHLPGTVLTPVGLFDEGLQMAVPFFVENGLTIFQDFYIPYGPGNGYLGALVSALVGDSILASRVWFALMSALLAAIVTFLIYRRRGLLAGVFMAILAMSFSTWSTYVMTYLLLVAGVTTLVGWSRDANALIAGGERNDLRLVTAGVLFALAAWFRFEYALVLVAWSVLVVSRPDRESGRWRHMFWLPWFVGAAPYLYAVARGGGDELYYALHYAAFDYSRYRGIDADLTRVLDLGGQIASGSTIEWGAFTIAMSFVAAWIGLLLLAVGPLLDRVAPSWRPFAVDKSRVTVLLVAITVLAAYSLSVRGDDGHASQLVLPLWLLLLWNPFRWPRVGRVLLIGIAVLAIVAGQALTLDRWQAAKAAWDESGSPLVPGAARVVFLGEDDAQLAHLQSMWTDIGAPPEVFVANRSNDLTHLNAAIVYWLLEAEPSSWLTTFDPGFADQESYQQLIVDDLCESQSPIVLAQAGRSGEHPEDLRFSPYLDRFFALNYELYDRNERFDLRLLEGDECLFPDEGIGFDELEELRIRRLGEGDLTTAAIVGEWQLESVTDADIAGDRILLAEHAGLYHPLEELQGVQQRLLRNWRLARSESPPPGPLAIGLDMSEAEMTGFSLYVNGLLTSRDLGLGIEVDIPPNDWFLEAVERDPSIGSLELLQRSLDRRSPGFREVAELIYLNHPRNAGALEQYGIALFDDKEYQGALEIFGRAAAEAFHDDVGRMMNHVGSALRATGDLDCSAAAYRAAVDVGFEASSGRLSGVVAEGGVASECCDQEVLDILALVK